MLRSPRRLLSRVVAPFLVASVALAGCAGSGEETIRSTSETRPDRAENGTEATTPDPAAAVREAAKAPSEQGSMTMEMVMEVDGRTIMSMRGTMTADGRNGDLTTSMEGMPGGEMRMLVVDGVHYYAFPSLPAGKEWVSMSPEELVDATGVDPSAAPGVDGASVLEMLSAVADDVEELGTDELFGVPVTGYRAHVSAESVIGQALGSGLYTEELADEMAGTLPDTYAIDVWLDHDGLPRRQTWSLDLALPGQGNTTVDYRMDFPSWGDPVEVTAPSPDVVISMEDVMTGGGALSRD